MRLFLPVRCPQTDIPDLRRRDISVINFHVVVNAPPVACGARRHTDIWRFARGHLIAYGTVFGLDDISRFGTDHFAACILVLNLSQKPVGNLNAFRVLHRGFRCVNVLRHHFPA